jgi:hypothetical protein
MSSLRALLASPPRKTLASFEVEMTDTYGGEANYSWVRRTTVKASSMSGALRIAKREWEVTGHRHRMTLDTGDMIRVDIVGAPVCIFVTRG